MRTRIIDIYKEKKVIYRVILWSMILILLPAVYGISQKKKVITYETDKMKVVSGSLTKDGTAWSTEADYAPAGTVALYENVLVPRGTYTIAVEYDTDTVAQNEFVVTGKDVEFRGALFNDEKAYPEYGQTAIEFYAIDHTYVDIAAVYCGQGYFCVGKLSIIENNAFHGIWIFYTVLAGLLIGTGYMYYAYAKKYGISRKDKTIHFGLTLLILLASMPIMLDHMMAGGDLIYHTLRIEGIKDGILGGQFPVRIAPNWQQGYGYADAVFYGSTLLIIPAMFRMIGFSILSSYRMFFLLLTIATVLIAYTCFKRIFGEKYVGLLCATLHTLSSYRYFNTYYKGSFGESFGIMLLPIVVYGFYRVFSADIREASYQKSWVPLTIGFSGLIQSHLLTGELVGFFTILLCLVQLRKVFRKETFIVLAKTVLYSILLCAWFLVPFADYLLTGDFVIQHVSARTIQDRGIPVLGILNRIFASSEIEFLPGKMYGEKAVGIDATLWIGWFLWIFLLLVAAKRKKQLRYKKLANIVAVFGLLAAVMSLSVFPWDKLQSMSKIGATLISSLKFPYRILTIAEIMLVTLSGAVALAISDVFKMKGRKAYAGILLALLTAGNLSLITYLCYDVKGYKIYGVNGMGTGYIAGAEYLPYGSDASLFIPRAPLADWKIGIEEYAKDGLTMEIRCANFFDENGALELPLLYYKGYRAKDVESGEDLSVYKGPNNVVCVEVPAYYEGDIRVWFASPWYWRTAEMISVVAFFGICICGRTHKSRKNSQEDTLLAFGRENMGDGRE